MDESELVDPRPSAMIAMHLIWHQMPVPPIHWERTQDMQGNVCAAYDALNSTLNPVQYWTYQRSK